MSFLSNLPLTYEILCNDPIQKGIDYGKSILRALSSDVAGEQHNSPELLGDHEYTSISQSVHQPISVLQSAQFFQTRSPQHTSYVDRRVQRPLVGRENFVRYTRRQPSVVVRRQLVGAL